MRAALVTAHFFAFARIGRQNPVVGPQQFTEH